MADRPWWRQPGGLPPSAERRRRRPLTSRQIWFTRVYFAFAWLLAVVLPALDWARWWFTGALLIVLTFFNVYAMPTHQRRQVFGR